MLKNRASSVESESPSSFYSVEANELMARDIGLRYVTDTEPGFNRKRRGKSFFYVDRHNNKVTHDGTLFRIRSLVLPPAWESVWICQHKNGHLQATGRDARQRKQYRYHPVWNQSRNETKFNRLIHFGEHLPKIRERIARDLRANDLSRDMVLAAVVKIMEETMIRIGNDEYAEENDSYGLTTIRNNHAKVKGNEVVFKFRGKSGVMREANLRDKKLSQIVKRCQHLPGQELFGYVQPDGRVCDVGSEDVNHYLQDITGQSITAKDFRTWGATVRAAEFLAQWPHENGDLILDEKSPLPTQREEKNRQLRAIESAAAYLGNTKAVCRKYYVHPLVLNADADGRLFDTFKKTHRSFARSKKKHFLSESETAVMRLLEECASDESCRKG